MSQRQRRQVEEGFRLQPASPCGTRRCLICSNVQTGHQCWEHNHQPSLQCTCYSYSYIPARKERDLLDQMQEVPKAVRWRDTEPPSMSASMDIAMTSHTGGQRTSSSLVATPLSQSVLPGCLPFQLLVSFLQFLVMGISLEQWRAAIGPYM